MTEAERAAWFAETVKARERAMYRAALAVLRRSADAEDAVSEAVESAWRRLDHLREQDALGAYLMRCAVNAARSALRRHGREQPVDDLELYAPATHPELPVWTYLMGLPEKYRLPLALRYGEDMSVDEIARALRLPRGTVSTRLSRGLKLPRTQMKKEAERCD